MAYTIQSGDTLGGLATSNNTSVDALMKANPSITDPNKIFAGSSLNIPTANTTTSTTPTVVSNYNTQSKVNDINNTHLNNVNTSTPEFPTGTKKAVYAPSGDGTTGQFLGYAGTSQEEQNLLNSYNNTSKSSFGNFTAPQGAVQQGDGNYLYQGNYYSKDQLSSPESLAAISNASLQQKKYDEALQSQVDAINKRFDQYKLQQEQITNSGAAGAQNALLQSGAGGRGSVAQYAAASSDARVQSIMQDGKNALAELDSQRDQLISAAKLAYQDKNSQLLDKLNTQIEKNRTDMLAVTQKANQDLATEIKNAKKSTDIATAYEELGNDPVAILNNLSQKGIKNVTAKDVTDTIETLTNQKGINEIKLKLSEAGKDPSILNGVTSVSEALDKTSGLLAKPNEEVIKIGNTAYIFDKNTNKIIKTLGVASDGVGAGAGKGSAIAETIIASGKFTKEQAGYIRNAINNGEDPLTVIKNNVKNIMGQTEATKLTNAEATQSAMKDLKKSIQDYYDAGGNTNIFKGNFEKVTNNLGEVKDPKLAQLAVEVQAQLQAYRNAISGTAYSDQEGRDIESVFPGINKTKQLNDAIFAGRDKAIQSQIDGLYKSALGEKTYNKLIQSENQSNQPIIKGSLTDQQFVEKALKNQTLKYEDIINSIPVGTIPVADNKTGQIGYIPIGEYNVTLYTKL